MSEGRTNPGLAEARRLLKARGGAPTEADAPPPSTFSGRKRKPLPGQLDLHGNEIPGIVEPNQDKESGR